MHAAFDKPRSCCVACISTRLLLRPVRRILTERLHKFKVTGFSRASHGLFSQKNSYSGSRFELLYVQIETNPRKKCIFLLTLSCSIFCLLWRSPIGLRNQLTIKMIITRKRSHGILFFYPFFCTNPSVQIPWLLVKRERQMLFLSPSIFQCC